MLSQALIFTMLIVFLVSESSERFEDLLLELLVDADAGVRDRESEGGVMTALSDFERHVAIECELERVAEQIQDDLFDSVEVIEDEGVFDDDTGSELDVFASRLVLDELMYLQHQLVEVEA